MAETLIRKQDLLSKHSFHTIAATAGMLLHCGFTHHFPFLRHEISRDSPQRNILARSVWSAQQIPFRTSTDHYSAEELPGTETDHDSLSGVIVCGWFHTSRSKKEKKERCSQGQPPSTYSVWVIGNDNCYIFHSQRGGNLVSASVLQ